MIPTRSHIAEPAAIRLIALDEFNRRRKAWQEAKRQGAADWPGDPANENLTLWVAIAVAAGVGRDLPHDVCRQIERVATFPFERRYLPTADQIAEPHAYLGELARARDAALLKAEQRPRDLKAEQRFRDLSFLADALGAPPIDWSAAGQGRAAA
jgi:hypothetical protein